MPGAPRSRPAGRASRSPPARRPCRCRVRDYVDFYASEQHATNLGRIFRPGRPPLPDNWRLIPLGYHGRAGSIVVSGTPVRRPSGVVAAGEHGPTRALDFECELGFVCASPTELFGVVILNDWSARDIQRFEYVPLGPFLGKSFATSISAWVVPLDALEPARIAPPAQDPPPAPHLRESRGRALDVALEVELNGEVVSRPPAAALYWTPEQMLAHLTGGRSAGRGRRPDRDRHDQRRGARNGGIAGRDRTRRALARRRRRGGHARSRGRRRPGRGPGPRRRRGPVTES